MSGSRKSIRLPEYDYTEPGAYFITILTHRREHLFGEAEGGVMRLSKYGLIIEEEWLRSAIVRAPWEFREYVVMPDHFHGIVVITDTLDVRVHSCAPLHDEAGDRVFHRLPRSLGSFVAGFKAACTSRINNVRDTPRQPVWQRNYYEHIIRDDHELEAITAYIENNPANLETDLTFAQAHSV